MGQNHLQKYKQPMKFQNKISWAVLDFQFIAYEKYIQIKQVSNEKPMIVETVQSVRFVQPYKSNN
jgi:hypothetical protein|nr:hypothetical protein [Bacilli bacterium]